MVINSIRIFPYTRDAESNLKATATAVVNDAFIVQGIRIRTSREDPDKLEVAYPSRKLREGGWRLCFTASTPEFKESFDAMILDAYAKVMADPEHGDVVVKTDGMVPFEVTQATVYPYLNSESHARARVNVELDGKMWLRGMTLIARDDGSLWLGMPRRQLRDKDTMMDIIHPICQEARVALTEAVLPYYDEAVKAARESAREAAAA